MPRMSVVVTALLIAVFEPVHAQTDPAATEPTVTPSPALVEIEIESSRTKPNAGNDLAIIAQLTNRSNQPVYLRPSDMKLILPPELQGPFTYSGSLEPVLTAKEASSVTSLQPNDALGVTWYANPTQGDSAKSAAGATTNAARRWTLWRRISSELDFMFFHPGEYKLVVVAPYWTGSAAAPRSTRTATRSVVVAVSAPQFVILVGSAVGGILAYFVFPDVKRRRRVSREVSQSALQYWGWRAFEEGAAVVGSLSLSIIVTILLSRLADTQFVVKITVTDFWGAIAVGFVANYAGYKALERLLLPAMPTKDERATPAADAVV
jgi:hypothetical protein